MKSTTRPAICKYECAHPNTLVNYTYAMFASQCVACGLLPTKRCVLGRHCRYDAKRTAEWAAICEQARAKNSTSR